MTLLRQMVRFGCLVNAPIFGALVLGLALAVVPNGKAIADPGAPVRIVALGDSLTAGFGLQPGEAFPDQLGTLLAAKGHKVTIANAGVL